jgi:hypothetical protein
MWLSAKALLFLAVMVVVPTAIAIEYGPVAGFAGSLAVLLMSAMFATPRR